MEVILKQDVKGTGKTGDVVKVSDGFARNKLIPGGMAVEATKANKRAIEREKARAEERKAKEKADAEALASRLGRDVIVLKTKVGEKGRLFGSVTSMDIAEAIKNQTGEEIDRRRIILSAPIKETGLAEIELRLYQDVSAKIKVLVEGEKKGDK